MRSVGLVTTSRSDWGILRPVAEALRCRDDVELFIIAGGMHLAQAFGHTVDEIAADGFEIARRVEYLQPGDTPEAIAASMGAGVSAYAALFGEWRPDLLLVTADRFDMFPAAVAATPFVIPLAHLHGGETTEGAFDDALRHAMTQLCHLHLVATEQYGERVRRMGAVEENVHVVGAPGLDDLLTFSQLSPELIEREFGFRHGETNLLVVYHPVTRSLEETTQGAEQLFLALEAVEANLVITHPNADTAHTTIEGVLDQFASRRADVRTAVNLPRRTFLSLMGAASALVGNSSAGIWEAPSFRLPAVNIGSRQGGRVRAANVIDCPPTAEDVAGALQRALDPQFVRSLEGLINPYGDGQSAPRIAKILATAPLFPNGSADAETEPRP
ncbi:MAG: UDP-N-acetylglucosamine 2-epimerase (hydrolyzing) [bacterium]|nr:UDP-N-acetylglucosamine 2-epimerase (hydrolyzing) [bacterium]